ncbi:aminomethyltransferase beta-barrel domain-containing protein [Thermodesulfobium sp. 4217-1]|uniref:MnmA/TRMU family protein n=1 Tax=Thermodesulfobium sp. 4217-1 TaxID=3120013 RepID=UPI0032218E11
MGFSGGIDSFYTAFLLKQQGFDVICLYIKLFESQEALSRASKLSDLLGVQFESYDAQELFKKNVIDKSIEMIFSGFTPNPCSMCNMKVKFKILDKFRLSFKCDFISTGHYVRVSHTERTRVFRGLDGRKDQSYFLSLVPVEYLKRTIFPLGDITKKHVTEAMQEKYSFWKDIPSSQDLCFVKKGYKELIKDRCGIKSGKFLYKGKVVANHLGSYLYTIGESRGLGHKEPVKLYVQSQDHLANIVYLNTKEFCYKNSVLIGDINLLSELSDKCLVQVRYQAKPVMCDIKFEADKVYASFHEKVFAPTPGQIASFYATDNKELLGGGIIIGTD